MSDNRTNSETTNGERELIFERSQKIIEALYRVTDLFPEEEPLKWLLRKIALEIFDQISLIAKNKDKLTDAAKYMNNLFVNMEHIVSLLELASAGSFISHVNFEVLRREYLATRDLLENRKENLTSPFLEASFSKSLIMLAPRKDIGGDASNGHDTMSERQSNGHSIFKNSSQNNKADNADINSVNKHLDKKGVLNKRSERQGIIVEFLKNNGGASVGELSVIFKDSISEKTIQRDLLDMFEKGILDKEGDKRWRRYSLKNLAGLALRG